MHDQGRISSLYGVLLSRSRPTSEHDGQILPEPRCANCTELCACSGIWAANNRDVPVSPLNFVLYSSYIDAADHVLTLCEDILSGRPLYESSTPLTKGDQCPSHYNTRVR